MLKLYLLKDSTIKNPQFSRTSGSDFSTTLKERVRAYFKDNNLSRYGDRRMIIKAVVMLSVFFIPILIINLGIVSSWYILFLLYMISGLGMAGVGMGVMHDAIHGSFSRNQKVNKMMSYTLNLIGASSRIWKIQHNVLHHTYTNINEADEDINAPLFLRFSPHAKKYWLHRYQFLYVWLFYGLSTISWITAKDFIKVVRYTNMGFIKKSDLFKEIGKILLWKGVYYSYMLILPIIILPLAPWVIILCFLSMHIITGIIISLVFQTAHVMPDSQFPLPNEQGEIDNDWSLHQLATTSNFSPSCTWFSWAIGGLNYQIEHHLMPHICHIHYKKISAIVIDTAREYGIPYHTKKTFLSAVWDHVSMLKKLGRMELEPVKA